MKNKNYPFKEGQEVMLNKTANYSGEKTGWKIDCFSTMAEGVVYLIDKDGFRLSFDVSEIDSVVVPEYEVNNLVYTSDVVGYVNAITIGEKDNSILYELTLLDRSKESFFEKDIRGIAPEPKFYKGEVVFGDPDNDETSFNNTEMIITEVIPNVNIFEVNYLYFIDDDLDVVYSENAFISQESKELRLNDEAPERYSSRLVNGMDVIDLAEHWNLNPQEMNILKYLLRDKGQDYEDMIKIADYAQREAKLIKQRENNKTAPFGDWL